MTSLSELLNINVNADPDVNVNVETDVNVTAGDNERSFPAVTRVQTKAALQSLPDYAKISVA